MQITIAEIIENLRQYPQGAKINFVRLEQTKGGVLHHTVYELNSIEGNHDNSSKVETVDIWIDQVQPANQQRKSKNMATRQTTVLEITVSHDNLTPIDVAQLLESIIQKGIDDYADIAECDDDPNRILEATEALSLNIGQPLPLTGRLQ